MNLSSRIFINYAREDEAQINELYQYLISKGLDVWLDQQDLIGGEQWEPAIYSAVRKSDVFLACLSNDSVKKKGVIEEERRQGLDILRFRPAIDNSLIPVRLEPCDPPDYLQKFQWVDLFKSDGRDRLLRAINEKLNRSTGLDEKKDQPALAIDIKFLQQGRSEALLHLQGDRHYDIRTRVGTELLIDAVDRMCPRDRTGISALFCLLGDHLIERYDYYLLEKLLELAIKHRWGENRYIVLNQRIGYCGVANRDYASLSRWFDRVGKAAADDLIEVRYESRGPDDRSLSRAMDRSYIRRRKMNDLLSRKEWKSFIHGASYELGLFLGEYAAPKDYRGNLVVIADEGLPLSQAALLRAAQRKYPDSYYLVAVRDLNHASGLYKLCQNKNIDMIEWRGPFELRYLLLQLNALGTQ